MAFHALVKNRICIEYVWMRQRLRLPWMIVQAMKANGLISSYPASAFSDEQLYRPNAVNADVYAMSFNVYRQLYLDLKDTMHKISVVSD